MSTTRRYEPDIHAWTQWTAEWLGRRRFQDIDIERLAEELESMGRRDRRELVSRLKILLGHLLKWQHQPPRRKQCGARFPSWSKGCVYAIFCRTLPACDQSLRRLSPQRTAMVGDWRARKPDRRDRISRISRLSRLTPC